MGSILSGSQPGFSARHREEVAGYQNRAKDCRAVREIRRALPESAAPEHNVGHSATDHCRAATGGHMIERRAFLASLAAGLARTAQVLPANRNIRWALSAGLWSHYPVAPFTEILDVMRDTGFIGVRLTGFPGILKTYSMTAAQLEREVSKRNLHVATISFGGAVNDPAQHKRIVENAREAMRFLQNFGAKHLVIFPPARVKPGQDADAAFRSMCAGFNLIGEAAARNGLSGRHSQPPG